MTGGAGVLEAHNGSGKLLDEGYDLDANAFLFGVVDFSVIGPLGSSVDLTIESPVLQLVHVSDIDNAADWFSTRFEKRDNDKQSLLELD